MGNEFRTVTQSARSRPRRHWRGRIPRGGTQSYASVVHDPDAPLTYGFTHWVLDGISASTTGIAEGGGDGSRRA